MVSCVAKASTILNQVASMLTHRYQPDFRPSLRTKSPAEAFLTDGYKMKRNSCRNPAPLAQEGLFWQARPATMSPRLGCFEAKPAEVTAQTARLTFRLRRVAKTQIRQAMQPAHPSFVFKRFHLVRRRMRSVKCRSPRGLTLCKYITGRLVLKFE